MANNYKRWLCEESLRTPLLATHFNIFWIQKQAVTHYCRLHGPSLAQKVICDKILVSHILFLYFSFFFVCFCFCFSLLFYFIINVYKNYFINFFFMKIISIFSCSGMFRYVPCSGFYRRPTQRYFQLVVASLLPSEYIEDITWQRGDIRILSSSERYFQHEVREILSAWGKNNK